MGVGMVVECMFEWGNIVHCGGENGGLQQECSQSCYMQNMGKAEKTRGYDFREGYFWG